MIKRNINGNGAVVIPKEFRDMLGVSDGDSVYLDTRENEFGDIEIVIRGMSEVQSIYKKYVHWAEVVSSLSESVVSLIIDGKLISLSSGSKTDNFSGRDVSVSKELSSFLQNHKLENGFRFGKYNMLKFLEDGLGTVTAILPLTLVESHKAYLMVLHGTAYDSADLSETELSRRLDILDKVLHKIK